MSRVTVIGAGTMGHGIAQVCAMADYDVYLTDPTPGQVERAMASIQGNLQQGVDRGKLSTDTLQQTLAHLHEAPSLEVAVDGADIILEAVPEQLEIKQRLIRAVCAAAPAGAWIGTNTNNLSIARIASVADEPGRVIGTHFFNPVHLMPLLEIVVAQTTSPETLAAATAFGDRIGKERIVVRDAPGFATSRLGVALGMEAIRMVEQGVASAEDIDKAMVLGYRHPVGPLKLTDMVGLDVRMHIGQYLARELENPAFEPPRLMQIMVADGKLGKKSGEGFYRWPT
jgi:3-hydroxybutyryl-CoA dehydrogenase